MGVRADAPWGDPTLWAMSLDMIATANRGGYLISVNPAWEVTLGYAPAELMAQAYLDFVHPDDVAATMAEVAALDDWSEEGAHFENRWRDKGGAYHRFSWHCRGAEDRQTILAVVRDVTSLREAEAARDGFHRQLQERDQLLDGVLESAPIGMAVTALYGKVLRVNRALREITGYEEAQLCEMSSLREITHPDDVLVEDNALSWNVIPGSTERREKRIFHAHGHVVWVDWSTSLVCDALDDPAQMVVQIQDISLRKALEKQLQHLADVDTLTGMPNRRLFEEFLTAQIARCRRYGEHAALLILDLDDFKKINDTYGHNVGDDLLKAVAASMMLRVRNGDHAARLGGDEFGVLLSNVTPREAEGVAADLGRVIEDASVLVGGERISTRASVGIACLDEQALDADATFAEADHAMYGAKHSAKKQALGSTGATCPHIDSSEVPPDPASVPLGPTRTNEAGSDFPRRASGLASRIAAAEAQSGSRKFIFAVESEAPDVEQRESQTF